MGNFLKELTGPCLFGMGEELLRGGFLDHDTVFHEDGAGRDVAGKAHLMGDDQHGHALLCQLPHDGQHLADAGSESFERDMAYNLLSNEKEMIAEIDAAIERIRDGTYGICEVTGKPIPESRLEAIPFTRCTKEGQEIKEAENKKIKSVQRSIYDIDASGSAEDEDTPS